MGTKREIEIGRQTDDLDPLRQMFKLLAFSETYYFKTHTCLHVRTHVRNVGFREYGIVDRF